MADDQAPGVVCFQFEELAFQLDKSGKLYGLQKNEVMLVHNSWESGP